MISRDLVPIAQQCLLRAGIGKPLLLAVDNRIGARCTCGSPLVLLFGVAGQCRLRPSPHQRGAQGFTAGLRCRIRSVSAVSSPYDASDQLRPIL
jgi:hypothetical protein